MASSMSSVLQKVNLGDLAEKFWREKITPDLVCKLSVQELESLGVTSRRDIMALRIECATFGGEALRKVQANCGAPSFSIPKCVLENLLGEGFYGAFLVSEFKLSIQTFNPSIQTFDPAIQTFHPSIQMCNCSVQTFDPSIQTFNPSMQIWNGSIQTFHHSNQIWNCLCQTFDSSIQAPFSSIQKCHSSN